MQHYVDKYHGGSWDEVTASTIDIAIKDWDTNVKHNVWRQWTKPKGRPQADILTYVEGPARAILRIHDENFENISSKTKYDA